MMEVIRQRWEVGVAGLRRQRHRLPALALLLSFGALVAYGVPGADAWLVYDRAAVAAGECWRLLTGHWTHCSADHLFWDVLVFVLLGAISERSSRRRYIACVLGSAMAISLALWLFRPNVLVYRGLSGVDSALFAMLALDTMWRDPRRSLLAGIALLVFVAKTGFELLTGATVFVDSAESMTPIPLAHVVGAGVGIMVSLCSRRRVSQPPVACSAAGRA